MQSEQLTFVFVRRAKIGQATAGQQAGAKSPQLFNALRIIVHRVTPARRRDPGQRHAFVRSRADVHAAVEQHVEGQTRSSTDVSDAQAAFGSVRPFAQPDAGNLRQVPYVVQQFRTRLGTIE